jgi:hypothetical protein
MEHREPDGQREEFGKMEVEGMQSFEAIGDVIALVAIITFLGRAMPVQYIIHEIHRLCNTVQC